MRPGELNIGTASLEEDLESSHTIKAPEIRKGDYFSSFWVIKNYKTEREFFYIKNICTTISTYLQFKQPWAYMAFDR